MNNNTLLGKCWCQTIFFFTFAINRHTEIQTDNFWYSTRTTANSFGDALKSRSLAYYGLKTFEFEHYNPNFYFIFLFLSVKCQMVTAIKYIAFMSKSKNNLTSFFMANCAPKIETCAQFFFQNFLLWRHSHNDQDYLRKISY